MSLLFVKTQVFLKFESHFQQFASYKLLYIALPFVGKHNINPGIHNTVTGCGTLKGLIFLQKQ